MGQMIPRNGSESDAQQKREAAFAHGLRYLNLHEDGLKPLMTNELLKKFADCITGCKEALENCENFDSVAQLAPFQRKPGVSP